MKFKKVEIQAFRAYDKAVDGTFNFELEKGETAEFISIYAPNGFGKTSFYDAVEYGMTQNIHRFLKRAGTKEVAKSERSISGNEKQYILRNRFSALNLETFIKIHTTTSDKPIIRAISKPRKKGGDYKFDLKDTINHSFQTVILSQEWIDAFLREDTAAGRYETFITHFGDQELDKYYQKISDLIYANEKKIDALKKQLIGIQTELQFTGDKDVLQKVNEKINLLNSIGERIKAIDENITDFDELTLTNSITERLSQLSYENQKAEDFSKVIEVLYVGNNQVSGIGAYFQSKSLLIETNQGEQGLLQMLSKTERQESIESLLKSTLVKLSEEIERKTNLEKVKESLDPYLKTERHLKSLTALIKENSLNIEKTKKALNEQNQQRIELEIKINSQQDEIGRTERNISSFPDLVKQIKKLEGEKQAIEIAVTNIKQVMLDNDVKINPLKQSLALLQQQFKFIESDDFGLVDLDESVNILVDQIKHNIELLKTEKENLDKIDDSIKSYEGLQKEITQLAAKGTELITKQKTKICPLCTHEHESFEDLSKKVVNNSMLPTLISSLIAQKNEQHKLIDHISLSIHNDKIRLRTEIIEQREKPLKDELDGLLAKSKLNKAQEKELKEQSSSVDTQLTKLTTFLNGITIEQFEINLNSQLVGAKQSLVEFSSKLESLKKLIAESSEAIQILQAKVNSLKEEMSLAENSDDFQFVLQYFKKEKLGTEISLKTIETLLEALIDRIVKLQTQENELKVERQLLETELNGETKLSLREKLKATQDNKKTLEKTIGTYEHFIDQNFKNTPTLDSEQEFAAFLETNKDRITSEITKITALIRDYQLLTSLKENVRPYLKYKQIVIKEKEVDTKIKLLKTKVAPMLEEERKKVSEHLSKQINSFFYEDLINDLYRRIDPHPNYKKIKFKCEFSHDEKPKLNVAVYERDENELIIPNLYFSTAQLNILSLSIFLAKALNAKDDEKRPYDCIFIDDPIQSMDSINILSTIDLLRSIVVNQKKQIILSTHDENFHNLLKKKIPPGLFKSKFMELETFGKVKQETV